jgi:hypothetical protein
VRRASAWTTIVNRLARASRGVALLIAVASPPLAAAASDVELIALSPANVLVRFNPARPAETTKTTVRGVNGELIGIDVRPARQAVYGVSTTNDVYTLDLATGAARLVSTLTVAFEGAGRSGFDFNPQADRLRLVGASGQNLRVNVDLGATATDTPLAYAPTDAHAGAKPVIAAAAYTNAIANAPATKLFDIDAALDVLALQEPPNEGVLTTVGPLGVDFGPQAGFEIVTREGADTAFAVSAGTLYTVSLSTGAATRIGPVGDGSAELIGLTAAPGAP